MAKIKITQVKSKIGSTKSQKATLESLGLKKVRSTVEHDENPVIIGMIRKVNHLVEITR